jgi:hypothetical protein
LPGRLLGEDEERLHALELPVCRRVRLAEGRIVTGFERVQARSMVAQASLAAIEATDGECQELAFRSGKWRVLVHDRVIEPGIVRSGLCWRSTSIRPMGPVQCSYHCG